MIKKIICPTDFSDVANNATQYAAKLAQIYSAELLLVHVASSLLEMAVAEGLELELDTRCAEITKLFRVSANYEVESGEDSLADHIASATKDNALVVMGTNGSDTLYQRFFGANTYQVIRKTKCPVLVVPEHAEYRSIAKIVFAWNYQAGEKFSFADLHNLTQPLAPEYVFLHVSTHRRASAAEVFTAARHETERYLGKVAEQQFEEVFGNNIPKGIDDYMKSSESDLLAITYFDSKLLRAFFQGQEAKKFIDQVTYPVLVLHV